MTTAKQLLDRFIDLVMKMEQRHPSIKKQSRPGSLPVFARTIADDLIQELRQLADDFLTQEHKKWL